MEEKKIKTGISGAEHTFHAFMSLFTAGCWIPVWIVRAVSAKRMSRIG